MIKDLRERSKKTVDLRIDRAQEQLRSDHIRLLSTLAAITKDRDSLQKRVDVLERYADVDTVQALGELTEERDYLRGRVDELEIQVETLEGTAGNIDSSLALTADAAVANAERCAELDAVVAGLRKELASSESARKTLGFKLEPLRRTVTSLEEGMQMQLCDVQSHELRWRRACRMRAILEAGLEEDRQRMVVLDDTCAQLQRERSRWVSRAQELEFELAHGHAAASEQPYFELKDDVGVQTEGVYEARSVGIQTDGRANKEPEPEPEPEPPSTAFVTSTAHVPLSLHVAVPGEPERDFHAFVKLKEENRRLRLQLAGATSAR